MSVLRRAWILLVALALPLTTLACSGGGRAEAERTTTTSTAPTTTEPEDPFAVPDEIDAVYTERVTNELLRVLGDGVRIAMREGALTPEVEARYEAVYEAETAPAMIEDVRSQAAAGFPGIKDPRGETRAAITSVLETSPQCVVAEGTLDLSAVLTAPSDPGPVVVALRRADAIGDHNVTGWVVRNMAPRSLYEPESDGCAAT